MGVVAMVAYEGDAFDGHAMAFPEIPWRLRADLDVARRYEAMRCNAMRVLCVG